MDPKKYFIRKTRAHRTACLVYVGSVIVLLAISFWFSMTEKKLSCLQLFFNFVVPFLILSPVYGVVWKRNLLTRLLIDHLPSIKVYALFIPAMSSCLIVLLRNTTFAYFVTPLLAILAIALTPYCLVSKCNSGIAIVTEGVWFILLSAMLGDATAVIVIFSSTIVLLYSLEKLSWYYSSERHVYAATRLALICFFLILTVIISFDNNPITKTLVTSYFHSSANTEIPDLFAKTGWGIIIPLISISLSAIYISQKNHSIQYYLAVSFLSLILVYNLGYLLNCFGLYYLSFNDVAPFISGGFVHNMACLCMSAIILPPKQVKLSKDDIYTACDFSNDEVEAVVQEVISIVHSSQYITSN